MMKTKMLSIQKMVAMIIATLIMVLSVSYYQMNVNADTWSQTYYVYDATTGTRLRTYTLSALETYTNTNTREVIGSDDRVVDWSKSGTCKIYIQTGQFGTGFVVDEHTIATAAHCVWNNTITDILLFDTSGNVTLNATPVEYHYPRGFTDGYLDYALITVEEDLSDYMCFNLGVTLDDFPENNQQIYVTGFSGDLDNDDTRHTMYTSVGNVLDVVMSDDILEIPLYYTADTYGGNSGGPVYIIESRCGYTYYTIIAIHTTSAFGSDPGNSGTRMNSNMLHFYMNNTNLMW